VNKVAKESRQIEAPVVIFVGAHPDDPELGCGGTIADFASKGYDIQIIYVTKGGKGKVPGDGPEVRVKESIKACAKLGVNEKKIFFGEFKDTRVPDSFDTIKFLEKFYHDVKNVYAVFIPSLHEVHQDHRVVAINSITAFRYVPRIFAYESPSTTAEFRPTSFVDVTGTIKIKWRALKCHKSQIAQHKIYMEYRAMLCISSFRGRQIGVKYAEAFETIKCLIEPGLCFGKV